MNVTRLGIALAGIAAAAALMVSAAPATAAVQLSVQRGEAVRLPGSTSPESVYDAGEDAEVVCDDGAAALAVGWTGVPALASRILSLDPPSSLEIEFRRPVAGGKVTPLAICASGPVKATYKRASSANGSVSCGAKLAIGLPLVSVWPYVEEAVSAKPDGLHGFKTNAPSSTGTAICVSPSAFGDVVTSTRSAAFKSGSPTASVSATCRGARRPIAWGYDAPVMAGNTWSSADTDSKLAVPYVAASQPSGRSGWRLTFRTPDGSGAASAATVALHLTCAVPK